ncbi:hypothetical protein HBI56_083190 [Parastagonospora nodorum]|uniref:NmrA-like domain-containing protein n=1 Tax=Phaeosphaeria nodorum (strain SN15 / ATCC MYA-4574 / FGSC 10173) TaxID=321614 RepID=A0A7U2FG73_PHANO|nr:hypothetical protein HBH56_103380 [Parastagonospora nodorum]QRD04603.1 hypothetical protein JI435_105400 [Parastagonospora nodorum SN15]KAH3929348.1 hypothetical protein HBH54_127030 [Parastagonospora nodorum]KAH3951436.1 hypothetical protein HBH53_061050 [Parastagonospora nodorum]KAH3975353.1 hypothetical protein HBH52_125800 [Parastagonospora nodorum]
MKSSSKMNMRVAVAGTCGLALSIAREINDETSHQLVILSRAHQSALISQGYQCQVVDYSDPASLQHALMGIDTVISTVTGTPQLRLIEAAVQCRVRRFAPAEFEGQPGLRGPNPVLDRGKSAALSLLEYYQGHIQYTVFVCGILYERFSVNGMRSHHIGANTGYSNEGDYIANPRSMTAVAPTYDAARNLACICLTSVYDVAQFVVRALDMPLWEPEMSMYGERMTVNDLVEVVRSCRNRPWNSIVHQDVPNLQHQMNQAQAAGHGIRYRQLSPLVATAEGRFDFAVPGYLNMLNPDIATTRFRDWFLHNWASIP